MNRHLARGLLLAALALLLALVWWGWQRGGLALMQLGMNVC
ncbi:MULTISPECIES: hypothetical protein [Pseudomonas]|jgi:hypothetical protein|nr:MULTISPECIES: hypothetical protein [Pseudomonas]MDD2151024.1 hypothetical protein [Pseudomonas putida]RAS26264.1 hypothetical protein H040_02855 [Pseudomonas sp. URMO17WK12:I7]SMF41015.1 hypothetical protein SAMN02745903_03353 [Pseudomonas sp. URMO17WK12:I5]